MVTAYGVDIPIWKICYLWVYNESRLWIMSIFGWIVQLFSRIRFDLCTILISGFLYFLSISILFRLAGICQYQL